jgi:predicted histidine transporter YuiF (NhaC family)
MNKSGMIGNLIGAFVAILIGVTLFPVIVEEINKTPSTPTSELILKVVPVAYVLAILGIVFAIFHNITKDDLYIHDNYDDDKKNVRDINVADEKNVRNIDSYFQKKNDYEKVMNKFNEKKFLSEKDLEKNL